MKATSPYHSYAEISMMTNKQRRSIYVKDKRNIKVLTTIPFAAMVLSFVVYGILGWIGIAATIYSSQYINTGVTGVLDFIAFFIAGAVMTVQGTKRFAVPAVFALYMLIDILGNQYISPIPAAMLVYLIFASYKTSRYEADLDVLKQFDGYPFLNKSEDAALNTYRNDEVIENLEKKLYYVQSNDRDDKQTGDREEYTSRKW